MKGAAVLAVCLCLFHSQSATAQGNREYQIASSAQPAGDSLTSYDTYSSCSSGNCSGSCSCSSGKRGLGLGDSLTQRQGQFFAYGEYIYARANFSEATAYIVSDPNDDQGGQEIVEYDFDHNSSYRFGGGYRLPDCAAEIVFNFARYRSEADFLVQDTSASQSTTIFGPYEVDAPAEDGTIVGNADVDVKSYDLGVAKTIPLGSPLSSCDPCCGAGVDCGTGCGWCPAWDITWSAGVRFAEADWSRNTLAIDDGDQVDMENTRLNFEGAGARVGLLGRRYIGRSGLFSIFAKGDLSLLVGDMTIRTDTTDDPDGSAPLTLRSHSNTGRRIIPVTEIEAGISAQLADNISLSSGYFLAAWHDLGMRDQYDWTIPGLQIDGYDDANILGFDGFFARAEVAY